MSFNPMDRLKNGDIDFLFNLTPYDREHLIKRIRESEERELIVSSFLDLAIDRLPYLCFEIIYDMDSCFKETLKLVDDKPYKLSIITNDKIQNVLCNTAFGDDYIYNNLDAALIENDAKKIEMIIDYAYANPDEKEKWIYRLSRNNNLHQRALFMIGILKKYPNEFENIYDNATDYLTSETGLGDIQLSLFPELSEKMPAEDLSMITYLVLTNNLDRDLYLNLKDCLLTKYKDNDLAQLLLPKNYININVVPIIKENNANPTNIGIVEFIQDADRLFETSRAYQIQILKRYSEYISQDLLGNFKYYLQFFRGKDPSDSLLSYMFLRGLGSEIKRCLDVYYPKSIDQSYEFKKEGSTSSCFRIGDYALKLSETKWSYEDIICPNLYLILKNEEETFIRSEDGIVIAGLEVQKYLKKSAKDLPNWHFTNFDNELSLLGYRHTDRLMYGKCGNNCRILDSYKDADCLNPESLPDGFKQVPLVLIDRDRVYPKNARLIKERRESFD